MPEPRQSDGVIAGVRIALCTVTVLLWSFPALALDTSLDLSQYAHTAWTFRNGFLNGAVYAIAQTPDGYLWLGSNFRVRRLDPSCRQATEPSGSAPLKGLPVGRTAS
jgi:hypothetical protein